NSRPSWLFNLNGLPAFVVTDPFSQASTLFQSHSGSVERSTLADIPVFQRKVIFPIPVSALNVRSAPTGQHSTRTVSIARPSTMPFPFSTPQLLSEGCEITVTS